MPVLFDSSTTTVPAESTPAVPVETAHKVMGTKEHKQAFWSFIQNPNRVHFVSQTKNEQIVLFLRQHPITQLPWILSSLILISIPFFLFPLIANMFPFTIPGNYLIVLYSFWYLVVFAYILVNFILWYYNVNIVTNDRVIDIDFAYLLVQNMSSTRIVQIEDVTIRTIGVFSALFDYGNVIIHTAGPESNIEFLRVPKPEVISRIIIQLMGEIKP